MEKPKIKTILITVQDIDNQGTSLGFKVNGFENNFEALGVLMFVQKSMLRDEGDVIPQPTKEVKEG
jgi:hypothetical protein